jgi:H+/Cl- antiporter ClcA
MNLMASCDQTAKKKNQIIGTTFTVRKLLNRSSMFFLFIFMSFLVPHFNKESEKSIINSIIAKIHTTETPITWAFLPVWQI